MQTQSTVPRFWNAAVMLAVVLALVVAWIVTTDRAGAASAPVAPAAAPSDVLSDVLALQVDGNGVGDIFAKYAEIDGESTVADYEGWSELLSVEWGAGLADGNPVADNRRRSAPDVDRFVLTFIYDKAAPKLAEKLLDGGVIPTLEVEFATVGEGTTTYLRYEMTNVRITDYALLGTAGEGRPRVAFANNFEKIEVIYTVFDHEGNLQGTIEYEYTVGS